MTCTITIEIGHKAISDFPQYELARILREIADMADCYCHEQSISLFDLNGNKIGSLIISE